MMTPDLSYRSFRREILGPDRKERTDSKAKEDNPTNMQHAMDRIQSIFDSCTALENLSNSPDVQVQYGKTTAQGLRESPGYAGCHRNPFASLVTNILPIWKKQIETTKEISPQKRVKMKAMGMPEEDLESMVNDSSPRNIRRVSRSALSDFFDKTKRELALKVNATDGLPACSNRVDTMVEKAVRTEGNCRLFEKLIRGETNAIDACKNLRKQIIDHFNRAIEHLNGQKIKLQELSALLSADVFNDTEKVKTIRNHFKYFKLHGKPGIGASRFVNPLSAHIKKAPNIDLAKMTIFCEKGRERLEEIEERLKINTEQLQGTENFNINKESFPTPVRAKAQSALLQLRESVEKGGRSSTTVKRKHHSSIRKTIYGHSHLFL